MISRYRGFAAPQLSLDEGVQVIRCTAIHDLESTHGWDDFKSYLPLYPQHSASLSRVMRLTQQVCVLYMERVAGGHTSPPPFQQVESIRAELQALPADTPVNHTLVWTTVFAAAESSTVEQQDFFRDLLLKHHKRNGFGNILCTIEFLTRLWKNKNSENWTSLLLELPFFVV
jgi:hypothetical protein